MNARPLTYVEDDTSGLSYTLSPSHLISGRRITNTPNCSHFEIISTNETLSKQSCTQKHFLRQFTNQWHKDYLLSLRENQKAKSASRKFSRISIGDIVILNDDFAKRAFWKLAIVDSLLTGRDGEVRAAVVRVSRHEGNPMLIRRSVKHLWRCHLLTVLLMVKRPKIEKLQIRMRLQKLPRLIKTQLLENREDLLL